MLIMDVLCCNLLLAVILGIQYLFLHDSLTIAVVESIALLDGLVLGKVIGLLQLQSCE